jgi:hypothetical protein
MENNNIPQQDFEIVLMGNDVILPHQGDVERFGHRLLWASGENRKKAVMHETLKAVLEVGPPDSVLLVDKDAVVHMSIPWHAVMLLRLKRAPESIGGGVGNGH